MVRVRVGSWVVYCVCVCVCNQLQQANEHLRRVKKKDAWAVWQSSNGAVHIKQTRVTLKKQQQSFCLSFILVLCCAFVNPIPTTAGSSGRLSSLWSPCESDSQTAHWWKNLQPIFATWRTSRAVSLLSPSISPLFLSVLSLYQFILLTTHTQHPPHPCTQSFINQTLIHPLSHLFLSPLLTFISQASSHRPARSSSLWCYSPCH